MIPEGTYSGTLPSRISGRIVLLEGVQDPGNVGTLIRTAGAFGYRGVILSDGSADPFSPKAVQGSAGVIASLWIRRTGRYLDLVKEMAGRCYRIFAATLDGAPVGSVRFPRDHLLMLGSEGRGLSPNIVELAGVTVSIPMDRTKAESLNVAVAGGILMYCGMNKK
jgi:TrmH family RNA methyltransferase